MTLPVCCSSGTPRRRRNSTAHRWLSARHTCSSVTCGFFPPQPFRVCRHEPQDHQGQGQMSNQPQVVSAFIVHQSRFLFGETESVLDRPTAKGDCQHLSQGCSRGVGDKVFHLGGRLVDKI